MLLTFAEPQYNRFQLTYFGRLAEGKRLDMYDGAASFYGFARTAAILGHFYATGNINAHAPRSEAKVFLEPAEEGSYKQVIAVAVLTAVVSVPLTLFLGRIMDSWLPTEDAQAAQIIALLEESNRLKRIELQSRGVAADDSPEEIEEVDQFIERNKDKLDVLRSITSVAFKDIFRPVGRSADYVSVSRGPAEAPIGVINQRALQLLQADRPDDEVSTVVGVVSSFSRGAKTGVLFSRDMGRSFRFEYDSKEKLPPEDDFSWSQYYQRPIRLRGRFVRFYDGKIKKLIVYSVERLNETEIL